MIGELDIGGVFFSPLLFCLLTAMLIRILLSLLLHSTGLYRHVWHRPLFDISLFFILVGVVFIVLNLITTGCHQHVL